MPCAPGATPRKIFPPPMTIASSTPSVATSATSSVMRSMVERLIPNASSPISASPESLRRTRLYDLVVIGSIPGKQSNESVSKGRACLDRTSVVWGKRESVDVELGGGRMSKKKKKKKKK